MKPIFKYLCLLAIVCISSFLDITAQSVKKDEQWQIIQENGNYGAQNKKGKVIVPAKYSYVNLENGTFTVKDRAGNMGKYDLNGHVIFPPYRFNTIYEIANMQESPFIVLSDFFGVINRKGKLIIKDEYLNITSFGDDFSGRFFILSKNGFQGVATIKGEIIIPPSKYHQVSYFKGNDNKAYFSYTIYGGGSGVCNQRGKVLIHTNNLLTIPKWNGSTIYFEVSDGLHTGEINKDGIVIKPIEIKKEEKFSDVTVDGQILYIYKTDQNKFYLKNNKGIVISKQYDWIGTYKKYFLIYDKEFIGLLSANGSEIISPKCGFTFLRDIDTYIQARDKNGNMSIISFKGDVLFPPIHKNIQMHILKTEARVDTLFKYRDEIGAFGVKNSKGDILVNPIYDNVSYNKFGNEIYFNVFKDGFVGLQKYNGTILFDTEYKSIDIKQHSGKRYYYLGTGKIGIADSEGNIIIYPETFDKITFSNNKFLATTGKRECQFSIDGKLISDNIDNVKTDEYTNQADAYFAEKNYKKAAEFYGLALQIIPSASLYFNRGVSYYNNNKFDDAIADFTRTLNSKPSERLRVRSIELIEKAEHYKLEKELRQQQLASAIFGIALTGINYALQSKQNKSYKMSNNSVPYSNSTAHSSTSSYSREHDVDNNSSSRKKQKCGFCGGKGSIIKYVANYGIDNEPWCDECSKKVVSGHYHQTCTKCHGAGEY